MIKQFSDLTPDQQDKIRTGQVQYLISRNPITYEKLAFVFNEWVDLKSIQGTQLLNG